MPELPDLTAMKRYFDATSLHQTVERITTGDTYVLKNTSPQGLGQALKGQRFEKTHRHGKNLLVRTTSPSWLRLHFGMTGNLDYSRSGSAPPQHAQITFHFENGSRLAYVCQRKLGRVSLTENPSEFVEEQELGPDALRIDEPAFVDLLSQRKGRLKSVLMNQSVIAGIGNVYADEIIFQSGWHPEITLDELDETQLTDLYETMQRVLQTAIDLGSDARTFPKSWLVHARGIGEPCPRCGTKIKRVKINQRSSYFCPRCQKKSAN
ncbi:MAG: Fpg/Nei family DNA glycosylase [Candidatus Brocadiia bacterium]